MKTIFIDGIELPGALTYQDGSGREREVGSFVGGRFYARGAATDAEKALRNTWNDGSIGKLIGQGEDVKLEVDVNPSAMRSREARWDSLYICWGNPKLTPSQFKRWFKACLQEEN